MPKNNLPPELRAAGWKTRDLDNYVRQFCPGEGAKYATSLPSRKKYYTSRVPFGPHVAVQHLLGKRWIAPRDHFLPCSLRFDIDRNIEQLVEVFNWLGWEFLVEEGTDRTSGHVYVPFRQSGHRKARWLKDYCVRLIERNRLADVLGPSIKDIVRVDDSGGLRLPGTPGRWVRFSSGERFKVSGPKESLEMLRIWKRLPRLRYRELVIQTRQAAFPNVPELKRRLPTVSARPSDPGTKPHYKDRKALIPTKKNTYCAAQATPLQELIEKYPDTQGRRHELLSQGLGVLLRHGPHPQTVADVALDWLKATGSKDALETPADVREDALRLAIKMAKDTLRRGRS
jgi:hypothetical protein